MGISDFKTNLEKNNLEMIGEASSIISDDGEVIMVFQKGNTKCHKIIYLKHEGDRVHIIHSQAQVLLKHVKIQIGN